MKSIVQADLIFYIEAGKIIEEGTHAELMRLDGRYAAMYALQSTMFNQLCEPPR
ncbi:hypothetical protein ACE1AT_27440 [Pelatocladus sp. BLCC-F211]|uniref:hypothetical protein n=1 Tax=Pelatocladus sp. BLCC-F211 TaxID=3342752 RepID=UPI0035B738FA